ncbi:MAG: hypothetical protein IJM46_01040 [Oscillospiraceae bacterium]|nr:hypothetical protein [Oscillospiraceae bacterium]
MEQTTTYCPKCGKPLTLFEDTGALTCTNCDAKMQIINGELRMQVTPNPAFAEASEPEKASSRKLRIICGLLVPVIWALACIACAIFELPDSGRFVPFALIGTLASAPPVLCAVGFFEPRLRAERAGRAAIAAVWLLLGIFLLDFICRLIRDFQMTSYHP